MDLPELDFVGMCIYLILPIWRHKFATLNDSETLNTMWQYSLLMMGGTVDPGKDRDSPGKTQYQATSPQVLKILWDSESNIKAILDVMHMREHMQQGLMASLVLHEHGIWLKSMYVAPPTLLRTDTLRAQKNSRMRAGLKGSPNRTMRNE